jgi:hypothetical protein
MIEVDPSDCCCSSVAGKSTSGIDAIELVAISVVVVLEVVAVVAEVVVAVAPVTELVAGSVVLDVSVVIDATELVRVTTGVATSVIVGAVVTTDSPVQSAADIAMLVWVLIAFADPAIVVKRTSATLASAT